MLEPVYSVDQQIGTRRANPVQDQPPDVKVATCVAVFVVNNDGRVVETNPHALRILDRKSAEVVGQYYWRFFSVSRGKEKLPGEYFSDPVLHSLATEEPQLDVVGLLYRRGGITEPFNGYVAPVYEGSDGPRGAVIIVHLQGA